MSCISRKGPIHYNAYPLYSRSSVSADTGRPSSSEYYAVVGNTEIHADGGIHWYSTCGRQFDNIYQN